MSAHTAWWVRSVVNGGGCSSQTRLGGLGVACVCVSIYNMQGCGPRPMPCPGPRAGDERCPSDTRRPVSRRCMSCHMKTSRTWPSVASRRRYTERVLCYHRGEEQAPLGPPPSFVTTPGRHQRRLDADEHARDHHPATHSYPPTANIS